MRKLVLSVVFMLLTLTTFGQEKEIVRDFSNFSLSFGDGSKSQTFDNISTKMVIFPKGEKIIRITIDNGVPNDYPIMEIKKRQKDDKGLKGTKYTIGTPDNHSTIMVYKKEKYGVAMSDTNGFTMYLGNNKK